MNSRVHQYIINILIKLLISKYNGLLEFLLQCYFSLIFEVYFFYLLSDYQSAQETDTSQQTSAPTFYLLTFCVCTRLCRVETRFRWPMSSSITIFLFKTRPLLNLDLITLIRLAYHKALGIFICIVTWLQMNTFCPPPFLWVWGMNSDL